MRKMDTRCLLVPFLVLMCSATNRHQTAAKSLEPAEKKGNFMEDEKWLSTISQYSRKIKHWNRFRDDDYVRSWDETQGSDEKSCTGQDLADLGERLRDWFQLLQGNAKQNNNSKAVATPPRANPRRVRAHCLQNIIEKDPHWEPQAGLDRGLVASCKDSIGWMFSKLDTNNDLNLDQAELAAINLDKYEICIRPFFSSCDSYRDGKVSTAEWCLCFWREKPVCLAELERIQVQEGGKRKFGSADYNTTPSSKMP
ncbi:hypothetical protein NHX12_022260 [Muraenolepis orangiensis]|uniref:SPARC/Testican calcium-binding domain-containing protein n=1 Tax=Muraenolepis orangiensis TaxID=630683 RepID=A0A9Q0IUZ8_9TELE|nr:hypothetical protein NHX12_022260 [Muraenolepis orangiensis]